MAYDPREYDGGGSKEEAAAHRWIIRLLQEDPVRSAYPSEMDWRPYNQKILELLISVEGMGENDRISVSVRTLRDLCYEIPILQHAAVIAARGRNR